MNTGELDTQVDTTLDAPLPETTVTEAPATEARPTIDDAIERAWEAHERARDEGGRFTKADQAAKPVAPVKPGVQGVKPAASVASKPAVAGAVPADPTAPVAAATAMPASWGKGDAELWGKMPPEVQARIAEREEQISRGFKRYEGLADYADIAERSGTTLRDAMGQYRSYELGMQQRPIDTMVNLAALYRVDPQQLSQAILARAAQPAAPRPQPMPQPVDVRAEVRREMVAQDTTRQVRDFMTDPANKYFDVVSDHVAALLRADPKVSLKDAYDQACWAHPQVRPLVQADYAAKTQAEAAKTAADAAAKARATTQTAQRASKSLVPTPGVRVNGARPGKTIDDAVNAAWDAHSGV